MYRCAKLLYLIVPACILLVGCGNTDENYLTKFSTDTHNILTDADNFITAVGNGDTAEMSQFESETISDLKTLKGLTPPDDLKAFQSQAVGRFSTLVQDEKNFDGSSGDSELAAADFAFSTDRMRIDVGYVQDVLNEAAKLKQKNN